MAVRSVLACRDFVYNKKLLFATHTARSRHSACRSWRPRYHHHTEKNSQLLSLATVMDNIGKSKRFLIEGEGPTDVLKALASTVKQDYTAPHYKYHDDPFFIPASNVAKRTYALAKESGRKAAKYFLDKYPNSFFNNPAEPNIEAFNAKAKYTAESDVVETDLMKCVDAADVDSAIVVYHNLKAKGVQVSQESLQSLLELLCFYNCKQPLDEDLTEERWHRQMAPRETRKSWKDGGLAEQVFDSLENKDSRAYAAVIQGMAKHFQVDKAYELFKEMQSKGLTPSIEVYNGLLSLVPFLREGYDNRWDLANELMKGIENDGLKPNISTMNNVLEIISRFGASPSARKYALQTFSEMKHIGVEPSLASYYYLLVIFCKTRGAPSTILHNIMKELENKTFEIRDPKDVFFFVSAMDVCHSHLLDKELAYKVHTLLNFGGNYNLIGDSFKESIYYQHFFKLLCLTENIDTFFDIYNKYVPNIYTPEPSVICEIIEAVDLSGAVEYLPQLWSDIILFGHYERENVVKAVLEVMAKRKQESKLQAQFAVIAADINERCDGDPETRRTRPIQWTGQMFGKMISVFLNAERLQDAWQIMQKLDKEQHRILGYPEQECLKKFCQACLYNSDETKALFCARYAADIGLTDVGEHLRQGENIKKLSENAKQKLTELLNSSALNSSEIYSKED